ncbi:hypothetical protein Glove_54g171 [Diversispora epigaea]|uniref:Protein kinase domain-containing protein n=1 Tax=Diversispora epigaea TaxID=1348612 RepID=A0A397JH57_9GLOM|nr:hypothetical protein Glove_54g171 [Diversispora epigaea]
MCKECQQAKTGLKWCNIWNSIRFQNEFNKWTSEDAEIDEFIQQTQRNATNHKEVFEWIPFDRFKNIVYLTEGGFGTIFKALWLDGYIDSWNNKQKNWKRKSQRKYVCLKGLNNSVYENSFLQEIKTQLKFRGKINGMSNIHEAGLMHKDFHSGNIVNETKTSSYIIDFGLCKPVTKNDPEKIYGVIPYMAPETLYEGEYTQASDIYSFGMIMYEVFTSYSPYYNIPHDKKLVALICDGHKPEIMCEIPQLLKDLMEKCWDNDPSIRPKAIELKSHFRKYLNNSEINEQIEKANEANKLNKNFIQYDPRIPHIQAIYTTRHLPFMKSKEIEHYTKQWDLEIPDDITHDTDICNDPSERSTADELPWNNSTEDEFDNEDYNNNNNNTNIKMPIQKLLPGKSQYANLYLELILQKQRLL